MPDYLRCGLMVETKNGVITKVRPSSASDPVGTGACAKGLATARLAYHPDRLGYPTKRLGERGEGKWERVSWDEALDDIATRLKDIAEQHGPKSIAWMTNIFPDLTPLTHAGYMRLMGLTGGVWADYWGVGDAAGPDADIVTFGTMLGEGYLCAMENPNYIIVWGYNFAATRTPFMPAITIPRIAGCKVVVIDPRFTETASHADEQIAIRPGTDSALALGMMQVILERGLQDERFIAENTVGPLLVRSDNGRFLREGDVVEGGSQQGFMVFDQTSDGPRSHDVSGTTPALRGVYSISGIECRPAFQLLADMVQEYTPERVSEITDVPANVIQRLAVTYGTQKPAAIFRGWGLQRTFYGDLATRAINTLAAITGNMNLNLPPNMDLHAPSFYMPAGFYTSLPILSLHDAVTKGEPFPVKAIWCAGHNPVVTMPDTNKFVNELLPCLDLLVVCDFFTTATSQYADYVLPVTTFLEYTDISMLNFHLQLQEKVMEPLYEARSDWQIAADLGRRMGLGEYFNKTEEEYIGEILAANLPVTEGISLDKLRHGPIMVKLPEMPWHLDTPTRRVEFYVEGLKEFEQELPIYLEPAESTRSEKAKTYPLSLLSTHPSYRVHSTMANVSVLPKADPEPRLEINPVDAAPRNISDNDIVRVFNDRGQVKLRAKVSQKIKTGVVDIPEGWWPEQYIEGHVNHLTHDMRNPVQQHIKQANAAFLDVLVQVEKVHKTADFATDAVDAFV